MALIDSNTYIEPTAGTSLNAARGQFNNSLRSLLTNFRSSGTPTTVNLTASGANIGEQDGMLYRHANANVNALYISDSGQVKDAPVGGNFTRVGIGNRVENGIVAMMSNATHYEIGELVATVSADVGLASNARLYLNKSNNNTPADFIDVGIPPTNGSVVNTMIAIGGVTGDRVNFAFNSVTSAPGNRQNAHLKVGTSGAASNTSILLGSQNTTSNVSIVKLHGGIAEDAGISIFDQNNKYAPVSANIISQSTIQGTDTDVAPLIPAGSVIAWSGVTVPSGWLKCDGSAISRTTYAALFTICGTAFGVGDGSTTFNIPDLKDRVIVGDGSNNIRGQEIGTMSTTSQFTTDSGTASLATGAVVVSVGAKDVGGISVLNSVSSTGHTHTMSIPSSVLLYIIKT
jgi:hypothetical protein